MSTEPILSPEYWAERLEKAPHLHQSIFNCTLGQWERIEAKHREILARVIKPGMSILDAGCAYGRLLTLLPESWRGEYLGVDIAPVFIDLAKSTHPGREFTVGDLLALSIGERVFDIAVLVSIRPMVKRNLGDELWKTMVQEIRKVAKQILYLEYDVTFDGYLETVSDTQSS